LDGDNLYAVADKDRLLRIDLNKREVTTVLRLPEDAIPHAIDAAEGRMFMVARGKESQRFVHVVNLAKARISKSVEWNSNESRFLEHMEKDRIYVLRRYNGGLTSKGTSGIFAAGPVLDDVWLVSAKSLVRRGQDLELTIVVADP